MPSVRQVKRFHAAPLALAIWTATFFLPSCIIIQKYPRNTPFVLKTQVTVNSALNAADRKDLERRLLLQLDDSLQTRAVSYAGLWRVIRKPPVFDTAKITQSRIFMEALLTSEGYFSPQITNRYRIDTLEQKQSATIQFDVTPGPQRRIDSIRYAFSTPDMQSIIQQNRSKSLLQPKMPYSMNLISAEIDRLVTLLHDNGYYRMNREDIFAEVDTVPSALINPNLDAFEQLFLLDSLRSTQGSSGIQLQFRQREDTILRHQGKYFVNRVTVYPDQTLLQDSTLVYQDTLLEPFHFVYSSDRFKLPFVARNVFLQPGLMYRERDYYKTINTFNRLGAWQNVDVRLTEPADTLPILNADVYLYPALKRNLKIDLEASRNIADYLTTSQFFGLGLNFSLSNRNAFRESIQTNSNARFGVEFGSNFIQTLQSNLSHTIYFPKLITPFGLKPKSGSPISNERTILNLNSAYTIRRQIYDVLSLNSSWGYEWTSGKFNYQFIPLNVEYTKLNGKDSLSRLIRDIPSLKFAFNDGFVIGMIGAMNTTWNRKKRYSSFKVRLEESGALFGFIRNLERNNLFRFIKVDVEYKHLISYPRSALAFRTFAGYGFVYGKKGNQDERILPFFKAYFAGGPYSMRAWQVRRLGPGSSLIYDTSYQRSNDRFGNMQLEGNLEYRFDVTTVAGIKVKSALFIDVGNIWGVEYKDQDAKEKIPEAFFNLSRLYKDLAVAGGTSVRLDFDFFLIRFDWAYKLKNPSYANIRDGWLYNLSLNNGQFQLGINYPF